MTMQTLEVANRAGVRNHTLASFSRMGRNGPISGRVGEYNDVDPNPYWVVSSSTNP